MPMIVAPESVINPCALCGQEFAPGAGLCPYHHRGGEEGWAAVNRVMCDFFHRGIVPRRLAVAERTSEMVTHAADAA